MIGNGAYTHAAALDNPVRDAEAMAAQLAKLGFDVVKGLDLDLRALGDVQSEFEDKLRGKPDVALLFYAGHGLQVDGRNYLVPIDAEITAKSHLATRALYFNDLLDDMARDAGASLIFLDACRDNPFTRNLARSMGDTARHAGVRGGLARIEKVAGTFIAYATAPDQVAYDGEGENSPFTSALLQHIETPGLSVGDLMIDVRNKVLDETNGRQEPWDQSSLRARFYFVPPEPEPERPPSEAAAEWAAIQVTTSLAVLAKFQERFPDPPWFDYAEARANELRAADATRQVAEEAERQRAEAAREAVSVPTLVSSSTPTESRGGDPLQDHARRPVSPPLLVLPFVAGSVAVLTLAGALAVWQPWVPVTPPTPTAAKPELASKIDDEAFAAAERRGALDGYKEYLGRFQNGRHAVTAKLRIAYLNRLETEFTQLSASGTPDELASFGNTNPAFKPRVDAIISAREAMSVRLRQEEEASRRAARAQADAERNQMLQQAAVANWWQQVQVRRQRRAEAEQMTQEQERLTAERAAKQKEAEVADWWRKVKARRQRRAEADSRKQEQERLAAEAAKLKEAEELTRRRAAAAERKRKAEEKSRREKAEARRRATATEKRTISVSTGKRPDPERYSRRYWPNLVSGDKRSIMTKYGRLTCVGGFRRAIPRKCSFN